MKFKWLILIFLFLTLKTWGQEQEDSLMVALQEVEVVAGVNPAGRLIDSVISRRDMNSPYSNSSFKVTQYHKFYVTRYHPDSMELKPYYLLNESVNELYYKKPYREHTEIIASKTSVARNPILSVLLTLSQTFSLYRSNYVEIMDTKYVNPIVKGTHRFYNFQIQDTLFKDQDTIFVIAFAPKKNIVFNALQGLLYVNKYDYSLTEVFAKSAKDFEAFPVKIIQKYEREASSNTLFSSELQAQIIYDKKIYSDNPLIVQSLVTTKEVLVNIPIENKILNQEDVVAVKEGSEKGENILVKYRNAAISDLERQTYELGAQIQKKVKIDRKLFFLQTLLSGNIAAGPINIDVTRLIDFNNYEGFRLGLGFNTNRKFAREVGFGGYFAYGLKDRAWKWGGNMEILISEKLSSTLRVIYADDIFESAHTKYFNKEYMLFNGQFYRRWLIAKFDRSKLAGAEFKITVVKPLSLQIGAQYTQNRTCFDYSFKKPIPQPAEANAETAGYHYTNFELQVSARLAFKERKLKSEGFTFVGNSRYPVITINYFRGIRNILGSDFNYNKLNLKITHKQVYKRLGYSEICFEAGVVFEDVPYSLLYVPRAGGNVNWGHSHINFGFDGKDQFATMEANEFLSSAFTSLFFRHCFGKLRKGKTYNPKIVLCQNIGFGWLKHPENHHGVEFKTMEKGYFESGIVVEDLLVLLKFLSFGAGVFYRYGAYARDNQLDNFAFKLRFCISM
ncbi:MAG: hypothetical protein IJR53_02650 [Bacteroidales bacterium]|nr:hypothetical protein [Bacteroidales bacterium]